jgi:protocatechuate 4,5-dioxygenase beta chain
MAKIVGGINVTHVPYIGRAIANNLQQDAYWKPFFDGFPPVRDWLAKVRPDVAVLIYNDHGLQFFLDKMPTFAVGAAASTVMRTRVGASRPCRPTRATRTCPGT